MVAVNDLGRCAPDEPRYTKDEAQLEWSLGARVHPGRACLRGLGGKRTIARTRDPDLLPKRAQAVGKPQALIVGPAAGKQGIDLQDA
jgi:hypothetical protein